MNFRSWPGNPLRRGLQVLIPALAAIFAAAPLSIADTIPGPFSDTISGTRIFQLGPPELSWAYSYGIEFTTFALLIDVEVNFTPMGTATLDDIAARQASWKSTIENTWSGQYDIVKDDKYRSIPDKLRLYDIRTVQLRGGRLGRGRSVDLEELVS
jgi:hypothetical protein